MKIFKLKIITISTSLLLLTFVIVFLFKKYTEHKFDLEKPESTSESRINALQNRVIHDKTSCYSHSNELIVNYKNDAYAPLIRKLELQMYTMLINARDTYKLNDTELKSLSHVLAVAKLSQAIFEGEIAIINTPNINTTEITIPPYKEKITPIIKYIDKELVKLAETRDKNFAKNFIKDSINKNFDYFGAYEKKITISRNSAARQDHAYNINTIIDITGFLGMNVSANSYIQEDNLNTYSVFKDSFPK